MTACETRRPLRALLSLLAASTMLAAVALVAEMAEDVEVVTIVLDAAEETAARNLYAAGGVDLANCSFLHGLNEDIYTRDWGPWFVLDGNHQQNVVDFVYEWPGCPGDEVLPTLYARSRGLPWVFMDLVTAGGNYMTDGLGTAASSQSIWLNNPGLTPGDIDGTLRTTLGIAKHHVLPDPGYYYLHIDCFAKYLSPTVVMVAEVGEGHPKFQMLEDTTAYFARQITGYGTPWEVVRVFAPNQPYTNSLILNDKVLVPVKGGPWDSRALEAYRSAMPGYEVIGFPFGGWAWFDALHCRTKEINDRHMLYVGHRPLLDRPADAAGFPIHAEVRAYSGTALTAGTPEVRWRTTGSWSSVPMTPVGGTQYLAHLPAQPFGTEIEYTIHAEDASGRSEFHPYVGEAAAHRFTVRPLGSETNAISASAGGTVDFLLDAGTANAGRDYVLLASASGTSPGLPLPGGLTLPLNPDAFFHVVRHSTGSPEFTGFQGTLDPAGRASARLDLGARPELLGSTLHFAFICVSPIDFVSNPTAVYMQE